MSFVPLPQSITQCFTLFFGWTLCYRITC